MEQVTLEFQERNTRKKTASRRLRALGRIPAVVYGQGLTASISIDAHDFLHRFSSFGENTVIKLQNGKTSYEVLVKDFQDDILTGNIKHVDFYQVSATKTLHARIPVHAVGSAVGVRAGGNLEVVTHEVEVECLAKDLPHALEADVSALEIGDSFYVKSLPVMKGVKVLTHGEVVIAHVVTMRGEEVPATEEPAAPVEEKVEKKA